MRIRKMIGRLVDIQSGILDGMGAASGQSRQFAAGVARSYPAAIGMSLRQAPCTARTHTHTAISTPAELASKDRRRQRSWLRRPVAILVALSFLLTGPACDSQDENGIPQWVWIAGGVVVAGVATWLIYIEANKDEEEEDDDDNSNGGNNSEPPGAPTSLAATANGSSQIQLSWQAPADNGGSAITGYQIEYRQGSGNWGDLAADTGDADTDYDHNGLTADTQYSYRIYAINANGSGTASEEAMATTASLIDNPNPGVPTDLTATAGVGEVTLGWTDPEYCGSGNLCSETAHQYYLEYKLESAADDGWGNGAVVASNPYTVTGLTNGMDYDFRLAVQLTGEDDRGPWAEVSAELDMDIDSDGDGEPDSTDTDDDNDGVADTSDAFRLDPCASVDTDGDGDPDTIIAPDDSGSDACSTASPLVEDSNDDNDQVSDARDAFPLDGCASVDSDGDGDPDTIIAPSDSDADGCITASLRTEDEDDDNDAVLDVADVDDDNDGLIEVASRSELEDMAHNLAGSSYKATAGATGDTDGAPTAEPANCDDDDVGTTNTLCGYELANDIDLDGIASDHVSCKSAGNWEPVGGCGTDGTCSETGNNDDAPFTAIFEGNGHSISNLCIKAVVETPNDRHDILGLFGYLDGATVRNLAIAEIYIESSFSIGNSGVPGDENQLGALAGFVSGDTTILNVAVTDGDEKIDIQGVTSQDNQFMGGLVARNDGGNIIASSAKADVSSGVAGRLDIVGGLVGWQRIGGAIVASFATGSATGGTEGSIYTVGGLVGWQTGSAIVASFATGSATGGTEGGDEVGGLVGNNSSSSIVASYAVGDVDAAGSGETGDKIGALMGTGGRIDGLLLPGLAIPSSYSFGFGRVIYQAGDAVHEPGTGADLPMGVTTAAGLTADNAGAGWSEDVWDFGDSSQAPALRYVDGYSRGVGPDGMANTSDDTHSYSCDPASFLPIEVTCGATLLPGQGRGPVPLGFSP